jgi:hypothetical protein
MPSSGMLRHVALVRTEVSEGRVVSIISVTRIGGLLYTTFLRCVLGFGSYKSDTA